MLSWKCVVYYNILMVKGPHTYFWKLGFVKKNALVRKNEIEIFVSFKKKVIRTNKGYDKILMFITKEPLRRQSSA